MHEVTPEAVEGFLSAHRPGALRYCSSAGLEASLARRIAEANDRLGSRRLTFDELAPLAIVDYRLLGIVLFLRGKGEEVQEWFTGRADGLPRSGIDWPLGLAVLRFEPRLPPAQQFRSVSSLDGLRESGDAALVVHDPTYRDTVSRAMDATAGRLAHFIESRLDRPGFNAVYRNGVVKSWALPDGTPVVSKRDNARKPGALAREQRNLARILGRFRAAGELRLALRQRRNRPVIAISRPVFEIQDPGMSARYAVWTEKPGVSLEDLLLAPGDSSRRREHLANYRVCLDRLFDHGIIWRDMSPRNILVQEMRDGPTYHLVDFEKVDFRDRALTIEERITACRSQFCVEELGVICDEEELLGTFSGLFSPDQWDFASTERLPFAPRAELASLLAARGVKEVSVGQFNRTDRELRRIRSPRLDPGRGLLVRPGLLNFKVEHYLSLSPGIDCTDYDSKTSEVLLAALRLDCMLDAFAHLSRCAARLEAAVVENEFDAILATGHSRGTRYPEANARVLTEAIDELYRARDDPRGFSAIMAKHEVRHD